MFVYDFTNKTEDFSMFSINKKVELVIDESIKYNAKIKNRDSNGFSINLLKIKKDLHIRVGDKTKYFLDSEYEHGTDYYCCTSTVKEIVKMNEGITLKFTYPENIEPLGKRDFFRMALPISIEYNLINTIEEFQSIEAVPPKYFEKMKNAVTIDISGSGFKMPLEENCRKGQEIALRIPVLNNLKILGTVVWLEPTKDDYITKIAISFKNLSNKQQDLIISYMFSVINKNQQRY